MPDAPIAAATDLAGLADRFWDGFLRANPAFATVICDRRFDDSLDDRSPEARRRPGGRSSIDWTSSSRRRPRSTPTP